MASRRHILAAPLALLGIAALGGAAYLWRGGKRPAPDLPAPLSAARMQRLYSEPLEPPSGGLRGFHIGHSLVGRDMPAMLTQLADGAYAYESQLGWGTTLKAHWDQNEPIKGFDSENAHPRYRDAHDALTSGEYDALILTEMVEIRDAIAYFDSWDFLRRWAAKARAAKPGIRIYLYETWHETNDPEGWLNRIDADWNRYWLDSILRPALAETGGTEPIYVIPGGQVMAAFLRAVDERGGLEDVSGVGDLMTDRIHFNDIGAYLVALTHFAVLFGRSPAGLPRALLRADGTPAQAPSAETAELMQAVVWQVVTSTPLTGVVGTDTVPLALSEGSAS
ncbi:hypothetical protein SOQ14_14110 [Erythrobacter sp. T5W1-R]|uniref:hypothetical protein n=1 Tax=Erythrobacter sp. T5W1-R TaxID=3101752 RepID=UPI002AFF0196|nr:hypothetical protein [Erythrobacter sp. T5W1-R]MEA1620052.1 hypothetical protein [Erythrobacter sp. T5W1-R]